MRYLMFLLFPCLAFAEVIVGPDSNWDDPRYGDYNALGVNSSGQITNTLLAGEDETNDVIRVENQFEYCAAVTADAQCGNPATFLHTVTCNSDAAATAGTLAIRDATSAGTGTVIQLLTFGTTYIGPVTLTFDVNLTTGLYLDFTTTNDVSCSASYR